MADADLDLLLARPGLPPEERLLIAAMVSIGPAAWDRLAACLGAARARGLAREPFEETLLQALLFFGFPRVITAFEVLQRVWLTDRAPAGGALPPEQQAAAGRALFDRIYGQNSAPVRALLRSFHGELHDFVLAAVYGRILTRPGLSPRRRELLAAGVLHASGQMPQLIAHARGALACGANEAELREALLTADPDEHRAEAVMQRVLRSR